MLIGLGIDIVQNDRIESMIRKWGDKFISKFFSEKEIEVLSKTRNRNQRLAANFAVKEAFVKAMGTGFRNGMKFRYIEVRRDSLGKPFIHTYGKVRELIEDKGVANIHTSISHEKDYSVAIVIFENESG